MKTLRLTIILGILFGFSSLVTQAQSGYNYNTGIGFRFGGLTSGITIKHMMTEGSALEGIASFGHETFLLTGLYEQHLPVSNAEGLNWFYGGGAHLGFFRYGGYYYVYHYHGDHVYVTTEGATATVFGADFILGLDYKFKDAPINMSLDFKPFVDFYAGPWLYMDGALSVRFVF